MKDLCGCGKPTRYMTPNGDACTKYGRCPSREDLLVMLSFRNKEITHLNDKIRDLEKTIESFKEVIKLCQN